MFEMRARKFGATHTSISKALRGATTGQDEFSLAQLLASEYDLKLAVQKFRFALCPKVVSDFILLLLNCFRSFQNWLPFPSLNLWQVMNKRTAYGLKHLRK